MSQLPEDLKYAKSHEWVSVDAAPVVTVGITDHAQQALGDIVFVELPEIGQEVTAGDEVAVVESVKAASDIYAPVSGKVLEINTLLEDEPETVNMSPYDDGWFFKLEVAEMAETDELMDADSYRDTLDT